MWNPEKKKVLDTAFNQIEKQFGKGAIMKMDKKTQFAKSICHRFLFPRLCCWRDYLSIGATWIR